MSRLIVVLGFVLGAVVACGEAAGPDLEIPGPWIEGPAVVECSGGSWGPTYLPPGSRARCHGTAGAVECVGPCGPPPGEPASWAGVE